MKIFFEHYEPLYEQDPILLVDIGSSGGLQSNWRCAAKHLRTVSFDADSRAVGVQDRQANVILNKGLYSRKEKLKFYKANKQEVSSILKPNYDFLNEFPSANRFDTVNAEDIDVDTLDNQLESSGIKDIDFLKLDVQGCELEVLKGARGQLERTLFGIEVEVEFNPVYEGQPLFGEVDSLLRDRGFQLFDLKKYYWKREKGKRFGFPKGQFIFADALYLRTRKSFQGLCKSYATSQMKTAKLVKSLTLCILYGYFDYAYALLEDNKDCLDEKGYQAISAQLTRGMRFSGVRDFLQSTLRQIGFNLTHYVDPVNGRSSQKRIGNM